LFRLDGSGLFYAYRPASAKLNLRLTFSHGSPPGWPTRIAGYVRQARAVCLIAPNALAASRGAFIEAAFAIRASARAQTVSPTRKARRPQ
jgi:hypothetical protein